MINNVKPKLNVRVNTDVKSEAAIRASSLLKPKVQVRLRAMMTIKPTQTMRNYKPINQKGELK